MRTHVSRTGSIYSPLKKHFQFHHCLLLIIILTALGLRIWGINFDLPYFSHPDEHNEVHRALRLGAGNFELDRMGKGGFFYLLFIEYGIFFLILAIFGVVKSAEDFIIYFFNNTSYFWLIGRITTAFIGTFNVYLIYAISNRIHGWKAGIITAAFMAFSSLSVLNAHFITVDTPMTFCVLVTLFLSIRIYKNGDLKSYILAGIFAALAILNKYSAAPVVFMILLAHIFQCRDCQKGFVKIILDKRLILCQVVAICLYVLGEPGVVLLGSEFLARIAEKSPINFGSNHLAIADKPNLWLFYAHTLKDDLGWPLFIIAIFGIGNLVRRRERYDLLLISFPATLFIFLSATQSGLYNPRYLLPILPFIFIISSSFIVDVFERKKIALKPKIALTTMLVLIAFTPPAISSIKQNIAFSAPGNPIQVKDWVEANIPEDAKILLQGWPGVRSERRICPLQDKMENMIKFADEMEKESPMGALYVRNSAKSQKGKVYDLTIVKPHEVWMNWAAAKSSDIQYVVVSLEKFSDLSGKLKDSRLNFYKNMVNDPDTILVKKFNSWEGYDDYATVRGIEIEIFKINVLR